MRSRPYLGIAIGFCFGLAVTAAFAVTQDFDTFISGRSSASTPLGSGDKIPVIQGGVTKYAAGNIFATLSDSQTFSNKTINGSSNTLTVLAASQISGVGGVANGFTGLSSYTSGGVVCATGSTTLASSVALTSNLPLIGGGAGACPAAGSVTGNTTKFVTNTGSITTGHGGSWDASGNWVDNANAVFTNVPQTFTAQQIFASVLGTQNNLSNVTTAYTFLNSDCGKAVYFTASGAITATLPNGLPVPCSIEVDQGGSGQITFVLGSGALGNAGGTGPQNPHGFTKTFGLGAVVGIKVDTNSGGSAAHWLLTGDGA